MAKVVQLRSVEGEDSAKVYIIEQDRSGGGGGGEDAWRASVESRLNNLHTDITALRSHLDAKLETVKDKQDNHLKWVLGVFGAGFLILGGIVAQGFNWIK